MKKILVLLGFLLLSSSASAGSIQNVYDKLIRASGISHKPTLYINNSNSYNAHYNGGYISINKGVMNRVGMAAVAFILAHEIGHAAYNHPASTIKNEFQADKYAYFLVQKAGFNGCYAARSAAKYLNPRRSSDHPSSAERLRNLGC